MLKLIQLIAVCLMASINSTGLQAKPTCQTTNSALEAMAKIKLRFTTGGNKAIEFNALSASESRTREAGFQFICPQTIDLTIMLFSFDRPIKAQFHMRNVLAPLDIAFVDASGRIDSIQLMQPYRLGRLHQPLYSSRGGIVLAIEAHKGFFAKHGINEESIVSWKMAKKPFRNTDMEKFDTQGVINENIEITQ